MGRVLLGVFWVAWAAVMMGQEAVDTAGTIGLDEVVVVATTTRHLVDGDEYLVTGEMRSRSGNVPELLNLLPGVKMDRINQSLSVENKHNVLLLVNGKRYSLDYVKSINPGRVVKIKVNKNPLGRYVSEGYDAIIDMKVRDYDGLQLMVNNFAIINANNNGSDKVMMEQPRASLTFTRGKVTLFGSAVYATSRWNTPLESQYKTEQGFQMNGNGLEKYKYHGHVGNLGLNCRLTKNHELSLELDYRREHYYSGRYLADQETGQTHSVVNQTANPTFGSTVFYKGRIGEKVELYSELAYSHLSGKGSNRLLNDILPNGNETAINERKHDVKYTIEAVLKASERLSFKSGYQLSWKKYAGNDDFEYDNTRNKWWWYCTFQPSAVFTAEAGGVAELESVGQKQYHDRHHYFRVLPSVKLNYAPSDKTHLGLSYQANGEYPTLSMLNPVRTSLHDGVSQQGNPSLQPAISHRVALDNRFWDMFSVNLQFEYLKNHMAFLATRGANNVTFTYKNVNLKTFTIPLNVERSIGKHLNLNVDAAYYVSWGKHGNTSNCVDGLWCGANVSYFNNGYMIDLGYSRDVVKSNLLQGYEQTGVDCWTMTASKQWLGGKLQTSFTWVIPTHLGLRDKLKTQRTTEYYHEYATSSFKPYRNALVVNVAYRFNLGNSSAAHKRGVIETEERVSGGMKL